MPLPQKSESNWIIGALYKMSTFFLHPPCLDIPFSGPDFDQYTKSGYGSDDYKKLDPTGSGSETLITRKN